MKRVWVALGLTTLLVGMAIARQRHHAESTPGAFDYYLLNLSWAPAYCAANSGNAASSECNPAHHFGFVAHGLWPENNNGSYPQNCGAASPVSQSIVQHMLTIMPSSTLIQHEWAKHGTCTGLSAQGYFNEIDGVSQCASAGRVSRPPQRSCGGACANRAEVCSGEQCARRRLSRRVLED